jgi:uncharacterized integral membrane protein
MRTLGRLLWLSITLFLVVFATVFAPSNEMLITLYLWPFDSALTAPVWLLILSSFIIGGLLSAILLWGQWLTIRAKLWRLKGRFIKLQAETDKLTAKSAARQDDEDHHEYSQQDCDQHGELAASNQLIANRRLR